VRLCFRIAFYHRRFSELLLVFGLWKTEETIQNPSFWVRHPHLPNDQVTRFLDLSTGHPISH
jgi:hypothetical protein